MQFSGLVQSGTQPLGGAQVTFYGATAGAPQTLGSATADANGAFSINAPDTESALLYVQAAIRSGARLIAIAQSSTSSIVVNELTTVASMYVAAQFYSGGAIGGGSDSQLATVSDMYLNLVDIASGQPSQVLTSPPNADQTNALRSLNSLANMLVGCVRGQGCGTLFDLTGAQDTADAMHNIAVNPASNVTQLFELSESNPVYQKPLLRPPDAWTLAVKVNNSGNDQHMFGGPGNLLFDQLGRAWILNNVVQGTPNSTQWSIVLERDGRPASFSPFTGGGLLGPGFGIAQDSDRSIWIGNFGWGNDIQNGGVSRFNLRGEPWDDVQPLTNLLYRVQGVAIDRDDNLWMASYGNHSVVVYASGVQAHAFAYTPATHAELYSPFGVAIASDQTAWVTNTNPADSSLCQYSFANKSVNLLKEIRIGRALKGIVIDSSGTIWIASGGDSKVYAYSQDGTLIGTYDGGGMDGPWGIRLDGNEDVWVGNFGPLLAKDEERNDFHGRVTKLAGSKRSNPGAPLTPSTGFTLPTAGEQVLLHDNTPLYGDDGPPSFIPMMRTTGLNVDQAGNVWTCNNWKPDFYEDHSVGNPGGDGMIIFIGVATPVPV